MAIFPSVPAFSRVTALASQRAVHEAFSWLHGHPKTILDWQTELVAIPAPPFGEAARSAWFVSRFNELGISNIEADEIGNAIGFLNPEGLAPDSTGPLVVLSAHLDTVFPPGTPLCPRIDGDQIQAPGICDNGAGLAGLLAVAQALVHGKVPLKVPLCLLANVGEEGEGNLRGVRHFYERGPLAGRVAAHIVLDGAGADTAVTQALGSRRFQVTIHGPGGHSFTDAGTPNPIAALASALDAQWQTSLPEDPRTTMNFGTIGGGTSVNSIPESATASVDFRSTSPEQLTRLEVALYRAVEDAVERHNGQAKSNGPGRLLTFTVDQIGDRPASNLPQDSPLLEGLRAVDRHLGLRTDPRLGSTDANIPLSLGIPALSIGAGGDGGGAHTLAEWYSPRDREIGLKRILLLVLAMMEWAAEQ